MSVRLGTAADDKVEREKAKGESEDRFVLCTFLFSLFSGKIPIPSLLVGLIRNRFPKDFVTYEDPATLVISLDRFLPPFLTADVQKIWIIDGGLAVTLGKGGADMPEAKAP
jgi:hypothetical protein